VIQKNDYLFIFFNLMVRVCLTDLDVEGSAMLTESPMLYGGADLTQLCRYTSYFPSVAFVIRIIGFVSGGGNNEWLSD
jgi:hypothetical protein